MSGTTNGHKAPPPETAEARIARMKAAIRVVLVNLHEIAQELDGIEKLLTRESKS